MISCRGSLVLLLKTVASVGRSHFGSSGAALRCRIRPFSPFFCCVVFGLRFVPVFVFPPCWAMASTSCLPWPSLCVLPPLLGLEPPLLPGRGLLAPLRFSLRRHPGLIYASSEGRRPLLAHHLALLLVRRSSGCALLQAHHPRRERRPRSWRARLPGAEPGSTCDPSRAQANTWCSSAGSFLDVNGAPGLGEHACRGPLLEVNGAPGLGEHTCWGPP